jgi:hypothetical protein
VTGAYVRTWVRAGTGRQCREVEVFDSSDVIIRKPFGGAGMGGDVGRGEDMVEELAWEGAAAS